MSAKRICRNCGDYVRAGSVSNDEIEREDWSAVCCMNPTICDGQDCDRAPDECDHHEFAAALEQENPE